MHPRETGGVFCKREEGETSAPMSTHRREISWWVPSMVSSGTFSTMKHLVFFSLGVLVLLSACTGNEEETLRADLDAANHCTAASDCVLIGSVCPFDCYIYVHTSEADRMKVKLDAFESNCAYSCLATTGVACEAGKCMAQFEGQE